MKCFKSAFTNMAATQNFEGMSDQLYYNNKFLSKVMRVTVVMSIT